MVFKLFVRVAAGRPRVLSGVRALAPDGVLDSTDDGRSVRPRGTAGDEPGVEALNAVRKLVVPRPRLLAPPPPVPPPPPPPPPPPRRRGAGIESEDGGAARIGMRLGDGGAFDFAPAAGADVADDDAAAADDEDVVVVAVVAVVAVDVGLRGFSFPTRLGCPSLLGRVPSDGLALWLAWSDLPRAGVDACTRTPSRGCCCCGDGVTIAGKTRLPPPFPQITGPPMQR